MLLLLHVDVTVAAEEVMTMDDKVFDGHADDDAEDVRDKDEINILLLTFDGDCLITKY